MILAVLRWCVFLVMKEAPANDGAALFMGSVVSCARKDPFPTVVGKPRSGSKMHASASSYTYAERWLPNLER